MTTFIEHPHRYEAAIEARIKANASKTRRDKFMAEHADWEEILNWIEDNGRTKFWADVRDGVREYGAPRPKIVEIVRERIAGDKAKKVEFAERDARSQHIGDVGGKIDVEVTVTFTTNYESAFGWVDVTGFRTDDDCIIIHKGTRPQVDTNETKEEPTYYDYETHVWNTRKVKVKLDLNKGDRIRLKATIKAHGEREGAKQTIVTRPKVTKA